MSAQNTLRFFDNDAISAADDKAPEHPMVAAVEILWALIAIAAAFATAMFLAA